MPMKTSSGGKPLSRAKARNCVLINQLATPGLGSCMAGRWAAGIGQILLSLAGFAMVIGWFAMTLSNTYNLMVSDAEPKPAGWLGEAGAVAFALAWAWAWVTSREILRSTKQSDLPKEPPPLP
jgi:hypothetical protein